MTLLVSFLSLLAGVGVGYVIAFRQTRRQRASFALQTDNLQAQLNDKNRSIQTMFELILNSAQSTESGLIKMMSELSDETSRQAQNSAANLADISHQVEHSKTQIRTVLQQITALSEQAVSGQIQSEELNQTLADFRDTSTRFDRVQESITDIRQKTDTINTIGQEAEMLALNAAIEAARAGDAGRGFAVVADSMKSLAKSSQQMSADIQTVLNTSHQEIEQTTGLLQSRSETLLQQTDSMVATYQRVSESVGHCTQASQQLDDDFGKTLTIVNRETETTRTSLESMVREFAIKTGEVTGLTVTDLSPEAAHRQLADFDGLIDVRRPEEFDDELGHIAGAQLITLQTDFPEAVKSLPKDKRYLFICRSGGRSTKAAHQALLQNIRQVYNLSGGMLAWREAGY